MTERETQTPKIKITGTTITDKQAHRDIAVECYHWLNEAEIELEAIPDDLLVKICRQYSHHTPIIYDHNGLDPTQQEQIKKLIEKLTSQRQVIYDKSEMDLKWLEELGVPKELSEKMISDQSGLFSLATGLYQGQAFVALIERHEIPTLNDPYRIKIAFGEKIKE